MANNYNIDPTILGNYRLPQVTMPFQQMQDVLTLADLMDKRKMNQRAMKETAEKDALNAQLGKEFANQLNQFNAPSAYQPPEEVVPPTPAEMDQYKIPQQPQEQPIVPFAQDYIKPTAPAYEGPLATPEQLPGISQNINKQAAEQYKANVAGEPKERIPDAYSFLNPDQYKNFLMVSSHNPDLGMDYLTKVIGQKKSLAEVKKLNETGGYGNTDLGLNLRLAQDPEYVASVQGDIDRLISIGKLPVEIGQQLRTMALTKPVTARQQAYEFTSGISKSVESEKATRPEKIQTATGVATAEAPIKVKTAADTETAKTAAEAAAKTKVAGASIPGFKPIQGFNITEADAKAVKDGEPMTKVLLDGIQELRARYKKLGPKFTGDDAAWYKAKVKSLQLASKGPEKYALGVLAGPDMNVLADVLPDPSDFKTGIGKLWLGDLDVKFKLFEDEVRKQSNEFYKVHGFEKESTKKTLTFNPATGKVE